jgi:hypothetical protein
LKVTDRAAARIRHTENLTAAQLSRWSSVAHRTAVPDAEPAIGGVYVNVTEHRDDQWLEPDWGGREGAT